METVVSCLVGLKEQEWYSQTLMTRGNAVGGAVGIHDVKCPERDGKNATAPGLPVASASEAPGQAAAKPRSRAQNFFVIVRS